MSTPVKPPILPAAAVNRILQGDAALLADGLSRGLPPGIHWPQWDCPLLHGIALFAPPNAEKMASLIVAQGYDAQTPHQGLTPLLWAIGGYEKNLGDQEARDELALALLETAPDASLPLTAMGCIRVGYQRIFLACLDRGCDINATIEGQHTLLHEAYLQQNSHAATELIKRGADPEPLNALGQTPFMINQGQSANEREAFHLDVLARASRADFAVMPAPRL